jgi:hypothetical protein
MKYIKEFYDLIFDGPNVGDYIVAETYGILGLNIDPKIIEAVQFVHENVGQLKDIIEGTHPYCVTYNYPESIRIKFSDTKLNGKELDEYTFAKRNIIYWSSNKEDAEKFLEAKKYNL